jgi:hypothetical protein
MYLWSSYKLVADPKGRMEHTMGNSALINKITVKHNYIYCTGWAKSRYTAIFSLQVL